MASANHLNANLPEEVYPHDIEELREGLLEKKQWLANRTCHAKTQRDV